MDGSRKVSEAFARVFFGFGPSERISRRKLERKRVHILIAWNPNHNVFGEEIASKIIILTDRCYKTLLPKAENLPD